ncbi:hypothetical protein [Nitrosomonas aestuarii]|nr:hypothetical protein [Nitrosomonas aestuarii]
MLAGYVSVEKETALSLKKVVVRMWHIVAGKQGSREAGKQGSREAGKQGE